MIEAIAGVADLVVPLLIGHDQEDVRFCLFCHSLFQMLVACIVRGEYR